MEKTNCDLKVCFQYINRGDRWIQVREPRLGRTWPRAQARTVGLTSAPPLPAAPGVGILLSAHTCACAHRHKGTRQLTAAEVAKGCKTPQTSTHRAQGKPTYNMRALWWHTIQRLKIFIRSQPIIGFKASRYSVACRKMYTGCYQLCFIKRGWREHTRAWGAVRGRIQRSGDGRQAGRCSRAALSAPLTALLAVPAGRDRVWLHRGPPQRLPRGAGLPPGRKPEGLPSEAAVGEMRGAAWGGGQARAWGLVQGRVLRRPWAPLTHLPWDFVFPLSNWVRGDSDL